MAVQWCVRVVNRLLWHLFMSDWPYSQPNRMTSASNVNHFLSGDTTNVRITTSLLPRTLARTVLKDAVTMVDVLESTRICVVLDIWLLAGHYAHLNVGDGSKDLGFSCTDSVHRLARHHLIVSLFPDPNVQVSWWKTSAH